MKDSSCFFWIYDSIRTKNWLNKELSTFIFVCNLIFATVLWITWISFKKFKNKKSDYKKRDDFNHTYMEQHLNMLFTLSIVANPLLNIVSLIYFIKINIFDL